MYSSFNYRARVIADEIAETSHQDAQRAANRSTQLQRLAARFEAFQTAQAHKQAERETESRSAENAREKAYAEGETNNGATRGALAHNDTTATPWYDVLGQAVNSTAFFSRHPAGAGPSGKANNMLGRGRDGQNDKNPLQDEQNDHGQADSRHQTTSSLLPSTHHRPSVGTPAQAQWAANGAVRHANATHDVDAGDTHWPADRLVDFIVSRVAAFCAEPAVFARGAWHITVSLDAALPGCVLSVALSHFDLTLRFETKKDSARQLLLQHAATLRNRLQAQLQAKQTYPRGIDIIVT